MCMKMICVENLRERRWRDKITEYQYLDDFWLADRNGVRFKRIYPTDYDRKHIGEVLGELTAIAPVIYFNKNNTNWKDERDKHWVFMCSCGLTICHSFHSVKRGIKDCGCGREKETDKKYIGAKFGHLTIIERDYDYKILNGLKTKERYYRCKCECGNIKSVKLNSLKSGDVSSCGHCNTGYEDLSCRKYGYLQPLYRDYNAEKNYDYSKTMWFCKCDCGNFITVGADHLKSGWTKSCGCLRGSYGEKRIEEILIENRIEYIHDKSFFKDLILPSGHNGRYDFILLNDSKPFRIIEFDGEQHNKPSALYGEEYYYTLKMNDYIKNKYAIEHNIELVRIPYCEKEFISFEMIFSDKYVVKNAMHNIPQDIAEKFGIEPKER